MLVDLALGVILLLSVVGAARTGFSTQVIGLAALVVGCLFAMWGHGVLAARLLTWIPDHRVGSALAFALILIACLGAGALLARLLRGIWEWTGLRWLDMLLGACLGAVRGVLLCGVVVLGLLAFRPFSNAPSAVAESRVTPWVINIAHTASAAAPAYLRQAFQDGADAVGNGKEEHGG